MDFSKDIEDWRTLKDDERDISLQLTTFFNAGEESVTLDLLPLVMVMAREGRLEDEMYLTQFLYEEAKHTEAFRRLFDALGVKWSLDKYIQRNEPYRRFFYEILPRVMWSLLEDPSPENQVRAAATYNMFAEGVLAETGYYAYRITYRDRKIMPGTIRMVNHIATDESRHIAYGTYLISRLVAEYGEPMYDVFMKQMDELAPIAINLITEAYRPYEPNIPFGQDPNTLIEYSSKMLNMRLSVIERARKMRPEQVYYMHLKELDVAEEISTV
jgi:ribonucleoside-diphosphate reductase beta chain